MIPLPAIPSGVTAAVSNGGIRINWNNVTGASSYRVYFATTATGVKTLLSTASQGGGSGSSWDGYQHDSGANNTRYFYWVTAINDAGESDFSLDVFATTPPATPQNLRQTANTTSSFTIAWNAVQGATRYDISYNGRIILSPTTWSTGWHSTSVTGTTVTINNCFSQDYYTVYVIAYNGSTGISSAQSATITATTR